MKGTVLQTKRLSIPSSPTSAPSSEVRLRLILPLICAFLLLTGCSHFSTPPGKTGTASWYGRDFHGHVTASGKPYDMYGLSAAHRTLPLGSKVRVTNLDNGRTVEVTITDRGPLGYGRIIDLSFGAARQLGMAKEGLAKVRVEVIQNSRCM
jgi:rare lipoprotein A (peptidoglycan hydrolase)